MGYTSRHNSIIAFLTALLLFGSAIFATISKAEEAADTTTSPNPETTASDTMTYTVAASWQNTEPFFCSQCWDPEIHSYVGWYSLTCKPFEITNTSTKEGLMKLQISFAPAPGTTVQGILNTAEFQVAEEAAGLSNCVEIELRQGESMLLWLAIKDSANWTDTTGTNIGNIVCTILNISGTEEGLTSLSQESKPETEITIDIEPGTETETDTEADTEVNTEVALELVDGMESETSDETDIEIIIEVETELQTLILEQESITEELLAIEDVILLEDEY